MAVITTTLTTDSFNTWLTNSNQNDINLNEELALLSADVSTIKNWTPADFGALPLTGGTIDGPIVISPTGSLTNQGASSFIGGIQSYGVFENAQVISTPQVVHSGYNGIALGPITIATGGSLEISPGSILRIFQ